MVDITVRPAVIGDASSVLRLHVRARSTVYRGHLDDAELAEDNRREVADYERMVTRQDRTVRCAEIGGHLVGFIVFGPPYHPDPDPAVGTELYQLQVDPDHHRRGIGTRLHAAAVQTQPATVARLWVWEFNERARAFYRAHGWHPDGHVRPDDPRIGQYRLLGYRLTL
ncbi:GNAT family N-acetyltransferase [Actinophytocola sediminis]